MFYRGRKLRGSPVLREMLRETRLHPEDLIMGYFVADTKDKDFCKAIQAMPGQYQLSLEKLLQTVRRAVDCGLRACLLFGLPAVKDAVGSGAYARDGIVQRAVSALKENFPELLVITDVCLCEYTDHGHCGLVSPEGEVRNDASVELIARTALSHAEAGADMVAPSDMMDGRVAAIRTILDEAGFTALPIMSYAVKHASAFYGPFREAAESAPRFGDRKSYQMDPANRREAMREAAADIEEGADIIMVKPAISCLDLIREVRDAWDLPVAAYQVSGEYSMIKAAAQLGWIDEKAVLMEALTGIKRAGAELIISYYTQELLEQGWLS
ncbi:porphobilinogen synthase [Desulfovibrio sp. OttesenSCG-928-A18]|nr:porphobilinogen synthase [Desulfovibrio sp. OttesenSCG-928-A18]